MDYKVVTAAGSEPITLVQAKLHLRVDDIGGSHPDDTLITGLIAAARGMAEQHTHLAIAAGQVFEGVLDSFPCDDEIELPVGPATAITSIKYVDGDGVLQTMDPSTYALNTYAYSDTIQLGYSQTWPATRCQRNAVVVKWAAALATDAREYKVALQAMYLAIGHWYKNRESVVTGTIATELPLSSQHLLDTIKRWGHV